MKDFVKMTLATIAGLFIFGFLALFMMIGLAGSVAALGEGQPVMPRQGILTIDMSKIVLSEQTVEADPFAALQSGGTAPKPLGIWDAVNAINAAATDPAIKFIYLKPDGLSGHYAQVEELRSALSAFRLRSGKPIVAYMQNPGNGNYYLASVADKIYMPPYDGAMNNFAGISSQMIFLKDILDKIGVNVQLIRHGKYKSAGEMFVRNASSPENMEQNTAMVKSLWNSLSSEIAQSRNISTEELNSMLDNLELNFPEDFLEKGLVDELLSREELENKLTDLYVTDSYENVKSISLSDYSKLKNIVNYKAKDKIAIVYANGDIVDGNDKTNIAGDRFANIIAKIRKDSTVKAVVLRVNSPGGSVFASEKIKAELDLLREEVPVIASYGGYAASGGYWISANTDYIFSNATTLTGSIGVFSMIPDMSKTIKEKLHVNITPVNSNKHADMYGMMRPLDQNEIDYMQASVEKIYGKFTELVANGRDMTVEDVDAIAQGRVWTGAEAIGIGLVDKIGTLEDAINYAAISIEGVDGLEDVQIVEYPKPMGTFEMLLEELTGTEAVFKGTALENIEAAFRDLASAESGKAYARIPYEIIIK
jgi:protease-4